MEITCRRGGFGEAHREGDRCDIKRGVLRGRDECDRDDMEWGHIHMGMGVSFGVFV